MAERVTRSDIIGLAKTQVDAHVLGLFRADELLRESGFRTVVAEAKLCQAFSDPAQAASSSLIREWLAENQVSVLCFSYRLDPDDGVSVFRKLMYQLDSHGLLKKHGGRIKAVYFAGLPGACDTIAQLYPDEVGVFRGDETPREVLALMGVDPSLAPDDIVAGHPYDDTLRSFGRTLVETGDYGSIMPVDRQASKSFGTNQEKVVDRIAHGRDHRLPPLMRAHAGPYQANRLEAVKLFESWAQELALQGLLDVLSIGTSQLSQERFGETWEGLPNGGGAPINSPSEYERIWSAARPMLARTYAGTRRIPELAEMYESTINIAWHALSLWWFSQIDGRGPNSVLDNLQEHFETLRFAASTGKPYEPNVPHHFAFRGADDVTYVVSAVLAAKAAKHLGISDLILQIMLNDPKYTWGVNDLAKARATLTLVRELEDPNFRVYVQTRAGLDYLSHEIEKAKAQLAAVTALMDDIEPHNSRSPDIIHVVSYSEGSHLAAPDIINDSIRITRHALDSYRRLRAQGKVDDMSAHPDVQEREASLTAGARAVLATIEECVRHPYTHRGLYDIFRLGFLPVPQLTYCTDEFREAVRWRTKVRSGRVDVYEDDRPLPPEDRMERVKEACRSTAEEETKAAPAP